jgi:hypothetical protein
VAELLRLAMGVVDQVASFRSDGSRGCRTPHPDPPPQGERDNLLECVGPCLKCGEGAAGWILGQENDGLQQVDRLGKRGAAGAGQSLAELDDLPRRVGEGDVMGKLLERPSVGRTAPGWLRRRVQVVLTVPMRIRRRPSI